MALAFRWVRVAVVVLALTLLVLIKLDPRPGIVAEPYCPLLVGNVVANMCQPTPAIVPLEIREGIPTCTERQLALLAPGFDPTTCRRP